MEDKLVEELHLQANSSVLDAGCGEGKVAIYLAQKYGLQVTGVDLLDWAITKARENAIREHVEQKTEFEVMDYSELSFQDNSFDAAYTMETLVHVPDYRLALQQFHRVLKPQGKIVLLEYSMSAEKDVEPLLWKRWHQVIEYSGMHSLPYFIHGSFPTLLESEGFTNVVVEDITERVIPLLKIFYHYAYFPYQFIRFFGLQKHFINATASYFSQDMLTHKAWRYNIITATKTL